MKLSLAKLAPPRNANWVLRERLFCQLRVCNVNWIHGPAGSGKSVLAASWAGHEQLNPVWLRVDAYDSDPSTLVAYLEASLRQASPRKRIILPKPDSRVRTDWKLYSRELAIAVSSALPRNGCLILDDVHELAGSICAQFLSPLMAEVGARHRLVLLSRLPPDGFEHELSTHLIAAFDWQWLRFTQAEADVLLQSMGRSHLPQVLRAAASGWPAGLVLLANADVTSEQGQETPTMRSEFLARYFTEQVFNHLQSLEQDLLCQLAPLDDFDLSIVENIGGEEAVAKIKDLADRQVMIERSIGHDGSVWYRIHSLFREYLRDVLSSRSDSISFNLHLLRLARLCAEACRIEMAIELFIKAGAHRKAWELAASHASELWRTGRVQQLAAVVWKLLAVTTDDDGWMNFWLGIALSSMDEPASRRAFDAACRRFRERGDHSAEILAAACAVEATLGLWDSFEGIEDRFNLIAGEHEELLCVQDPALRMLALAGYLHGSIHLSRENEAIDKLLHHLVQDLELPVDPNICLLASTVAMSVADILENTDLVLHIVLRMEHVAADKAVTPYRKAYWHLHAGEALHFISLQGQHFEAARQARRHLGLAEKSASEHGYSTLLFRIRRRKASVAWREGDLEGAEAEMAQAQALLSFQQTAHRLEFHYLRSQILILRNRVNEAEREGLIAVDLAERSRAPARVCCIYWVHMYAICLRQGKIEEAKQWIRRASAASGGGHSRAYERALAMAEALDSLKSGRDIVGKVQHYFALAKETRAFNSAPFNSPQLSELAAAAVRFDIETEYVCELVKLRNLTPELPAPRGWPWAVRVRVLGQSRLFLYGKVFVSSGKSQKKPLELLFWLAAHGRRAYSGLPVSSAIGELWPDLDADDPKGSFEIALHRLRKLIGLDDVVILRDGQLSLDERRVSLDVAEFEATLDPSFPEADLQSESDADSVYAGELLPGNLAPWTISLRERWRQKFIEHVGKRARALEADGRWEDAIRVYESGLAQDNLVEEFYAGCMRASIALGRPSEGMRYFRRCRELLSIVLGIAPSELTESLRQSLAAQVTR